MTPVDTSVTFTGNSVLSALDIAKMECLYYCDGTNPGTCGGHKQGVEIQDRTFWISFVKAMVEILSRLENLSQADASGCSELTMDMASN